MIEKPSKRPGRKLRRRARGPIFLIILRFNPRPARISMTISASSRTSSEIESNDSSIRFITPGPKAIPSDTRPIRPGRRTLSKSESTAIERITIREMLRIICSSRVKQNQATNFGRSYQLVAVLEDCSPRQASLPRELYSLCVILSMTSERR